MEEKTMHFANFNITFGENEEPMLLHFEDIIFPAFTGEYKRGKEGEYPIFTFSGVEIKKSKEAGYILVGNYVKDTQVTVRTTFINRKITSSPAEIPTAPYSRFIIFLNNHRMILVRNEPSSPDIKSFQATVRFILSAFIRTKNKEKDGNNPLPQAIVNIVDIPLKDDIETLLREVMKIKSIRLRFFPLNNDINPLPVAQAINDEMKKIGCRTANTKFNSPDSKTGVKKLLEDTAGLAIATMDIIDNDGESKQIKEGSFTSNRKILFAKDIAAGDDELLVSLAKKDKVINKISEDNLSLYKRVTAMFERLTIMK